MFLFILTKLICVMVAQFIYPAASLNKTSHFSGTVCRLVLAVAILNVTMLFVLVIEKC